MKYLLLVIALLNCTRTQAQNSSPDETFRRLEVRVSSLFNFEQKSVIAEALSRIPFCHQAKLRGLRIVYSRDLDGPKDGCTEGFYPGNGSIVLYPRCGFDVGTVVHESFHHLGRFDHLNETWKHDVLRKFPRCPVSEYAEEGLGSNNEDLSETGRLLLVPESGDRNPDTCVDSKIKELRKLLEC